MIKKGKEEEKGKVMDNGWGGKRASGQAGKRASDQIE